MVIAVIRIAGSVNISKDNNETFNRLRLGRKLTCTFVDEKDEIRMGMVKKLAQVISFGEVDKKLMDEVIAKRGQKDSKGVYREFCRLHPPRGGFKKPTNRSTPEGILGHNQNITKLLERML
jgi:ribosomal protein L30/L7E